MKRISVFFMAILIAAAGLAGCAKADGTVGETTSGSLTENTGTETAADTGDKPDIEKSDYSGEEFMILYIDWALYSKYYFSEEANGDAVNDAIFERTSTIEEYLNIDINSVTFGNTDTPEYEAMKKTVLAGEDAYDLALIHNSSDIGKYVSDGIVMNWNDIPCIDMTKSYWNQSVRENMEIAGVLPFASNSFMIPDVTSIFFNKQLIENFKLEDPYELVKSGKWTWDKLIEMSSGASADINGDGKFDENDQYGFVTEFDWQTASIVAGCGQYMVQKDENGEPQIVFNTEKMVSIIEKINNFVSNGNLTFTWPYSPATDPNAGGTPPVSFDSGRALFYSVPLSLAGVFRETDVEFGILPTPKYNVEQKDYITLNWAGFMCVPASVRNTELVGKTTELLGYYNGKIVMPAFYDILLGQKISRDTESQEMLDIIFGNTVYDLGVNLGFQFYMVLPYTINSGGNFASYYESQIKSLESIVDKYYNAHIEYSMVQG
jgi:ABC-type glycerol-3-phosphate transport system substrate-binding protein